MPNDWTTAPYVRVFVTLADDRPALWGSDELLAWYVRLLVGANAYYPASAPIPRDVPTAVLDSLESDEVVDVERGRYRFHGLRKVRAGAIARGSEGGRARARDANRVAGRFAGRESLVGDAGSSSSNAGSVAGLDAGPDRWSPSLDDQFAPTGDGPANEPANGESLVADAGRLSSNAGTESLVGVAGRPANQRKEKIDKKDEEPPPIVGGSSSSTSTPRAPAPAREDAVEGADDPTGPVSPGQRAAMVRAHGPDDADCEEPDLHPLHHRWYPGVGWRCLLCERSDNRSFDDLFAEAGGRIPPRPGSPF